MVTQNAPSYNISLDLFPASHTLKSSTQRLLNDLPTALHALYTNFDEESPEYKVVQDCKTAFRRNADARSPLGEVLCNTALSANLRQAYLFRYNLELCENVHRDNTMSRRVSRRDISNDFRKSPFTKMKHLIRDHYEVYPLETNSTTAVCRIELWVKLLKNNLCSILERCKQLHREPCLLTLEDCVHLGKQHTIPVPPQLAKSKRIRVVNPFSERVQHTRANSKVSQQSHPTLMSAVSVHVMGSRERSSISRSNGSLTLSATDDTSRAVQYAIFYGQVIPCILWLDIDPQYTVHTPDVLKEGNCKMHHAINISTKHREYIPTMVTHFPDEAIRSIHPLWVHNFEVNPLNCPRNTPFRETWMHHEDKYTSSELIQELQLIRERLSQRTSALSEACTKKRECPVRTRLYSVGGQMCSRRHKRRCVWGNRVGCGVY